MSKLCALSSCPVDLGRPSLLLLAIKDKYEAALETKRNKTEQRHRIALEESAAWEFLATTSFHRVRVTQWYEQTSIRAHHKEL